MLGALSSTTFIYYMGFLHIFTLPQFLHCRRFSRGSHLSEAAFQVACGGIAQEGEKDKLCS